MDIYILDTLITTFHCNGKISKSIIIKNVMEDAQKDEGYTHLQIQMGYAVMRIYRSYKLFRLGRNKRCQVG